MESEDTNMANNYDAEEAARRLMGGGDAPKPKSAADKGATPRPGSRTKPPVQTERKKSGRKKEYEGDSETLLAKIPRSAKNAMRHMVADHPGSYTQSKIVREALYAYKPLKPYLADEEE
jgi:hypothetical protein